MAKGRSVEKSAGPNGPRIPFQGFRVVFGLANAALWFVIAFGVLSGITLGVEASGRLSRNAAVVMFAVVGFFVCFFGLPGAVGGFLGQAKSGRLELPPVDKWGPGALGPIHRIAAIRGLISAGVMAALTSWYFGNHWVPARERLCVLIGAAAALIALVQSATLAGPGALGDIRDKSRETPPAPDSRYFWNRFILPQGFGNGLITGLVAWGTHPPAGTPLPVNQVVMSSVATALLIGLFMLFTGGGLATVDEKFQRIAAIAGPPRSWPRRMQVLAGITAAGALIGFALGSISGPSGPPQWAMALWQFVLGGVTAGITVAVAARAVLAQPAR